MGPTANNAAKTLCDHGHDLEGDNLYVAPRSGQRKCRACMKRIAEEKKARFKGPRRTKPGKVVLRIQMEDRTFVELGEHYGVSDTAVRKWAKGYGLI